MNKTNLDEFRYHLDTHNRLTGRLTDYRFYLALAIMAGWVALRSGSLDTISPWIPILALGSVVMLGIEVWLVQEAVTCSLTRRDKPRGWFNWVVIMRTCSMVALLLSMVVMFFGLLDGSGTVARQVIG